MAQEHVIYALVRKYAELAGQLKKLNAETAELAAQLEHVRATILIFQPGYRVKSIAPKRPKAKSSYGTKGKLIRLVLEALRDAREPVSAREIAERVLTARGVLEPDQERVKLTIRAVNVSLRSLERRSVVASPDKGPKQFNLWELAR